MTAMFVNLPVTDLERAKAFYTAVGFTINPAFTDHNAACVVVEEDHSYFMILVREFFQTFTDLPIGDPTVSPSVSTAIFLNSREDVDATVVKGLAAGGVEPRPATDYGFMYQRQINDPDGNLLEAVSLLSPGRGLRRATFETIGTQGSDGSPITPDGVQCDTAANAHCVVWGLPVYNASYGQLDGSIFFKFLNDKISMGVEAQNLTNATNRVLMKQSIGLMGRAWFVSDRRYTATMRLTF